MKKQSLSDIFPLQIAKKRQALEFISIMRKAVHLARLARVGKTVFFGSSVPVPVGSVQAATVGHDNRMVSFAFFC